MMDQPKWRFEGSATFEWLGDAFLVMRSTWEDASDDAGRTSRKDLDYIFEPATIRSGRGLD